MVFLIFESEIQLPRLFLGISEIKNQLLSKPFGTLPFII
jgi:hypothetical protein